MDSENITDASSIMQVRIQLHSAIYHSKNVKKYSPKACSQEISSVLNFNIQLHFHKKSCLTPGL